MLWKLQVNESALIYLIFSHCVCFTDELHNHEIAEAINAIVFAKCELVIEIQSLFVCNQRYHNLFPSIVFGYSSSDLITRYSEVVWGIQIPRFSIPFLI